MPPNTAPLNPLEFKKPQALIEAETRAEDLIGPLVEQGMAIIKKLREEIEGVELPTRFKRDVPMKEFRKRLGIAGLDGPLSYLAREAIEKEGEAGYKKAQLAIDLIGIEQRLLRFAEIFGKLIVDFEISKMNEEVEE